MGMFGNCDFHIEYQTMQTMHNKAFHGCAHGVCDLSDLTFITKTPCTVLKLFSFIDFWDLESVRLSVPCVISMCAYICLKWTN